MAGLGPYMHLEVDRSKKKKEKRTDKVTVSGAERFKEGVASSTPGIKSQ